MSMAATSAQFAADVPSVLAGDAGG